MKYHLISITENKLAITAIKRLRETQKKSYRRVTKNPRNVEKYSASNGDKIK